MPAEYTPEFIARFWSRVDKTSSPHGCWLWKGAKTTAGYGSLHANGKTAYAHRIACELLYGPLPAGTVVCHRCPGGDNRACVRHIVPADFKTNTAHALADGHLHGRITCTGLPPRPKQPKVLKGLARGERSGTSVLTDADVRAIRAAFAAKAATLVELGRRYRVTPQNISYIVRRKAWTHLP